MKNHCIFCQVKETRQTSRRAMSVNEWGQWDSQTAGQRRADGQWNSCTKGGADGQWNSWTKGGADEQCDSG